MSSTHSVFTIRHETDADVEAINQITFDAFQSEDYPNPTEHNIVAGLRTSNALTLSLVAERNSQVIGHVAISPVLISDGTEHWVGLGPLSVKPDAQNQGVGSALVQKALAEIKSHVAGCVVLGNPKYYGRFGFKAESTLVLPGVPVDAFQAIKFSGQMPVGTVAYHRAFDGS